MGNGKQKIEDGRGKMEDGSKGKKGNNGIVE